jgi:formylglycine-generating enzyme required for sulfatase activity
VSLTKPFCLDETEVTAAAYAKCVDDGACKKAGHGDRWASFRRFPEHPINLVGWTQAKNYCEKQGKALPTEAQWEWAASGGDGREWPWGNEPPTCQNGLMDFTPGGAPKSTPGGDVGCHGGGPSPVRSHPKGARTWPSGTIYDLGGNVWEWTLDSFGPYSKEPQTDPLVVNPKTLVHSIRGGGWNRSAIGCTTWFRAAAVDNYHVPGLGFRCARAPE